MTISSALADFVVRGNLADLPEDALIHAKWLVLDSLGSMIGSRDIDSSQIARRVALRMGGPPDSTVVGQRAKVASANAAFANAIQAYAFDFVDDHNESNSHPSAATIPTALALGEKLDRSGADVLTAIAIGNEVVCRLGSSFLGKTYYQGFHPTSTCGTFGATVSAAKLLGLDRDLVANSLGIAGSMAAGLMEWKAGGSVTKRLQAGHPAMCGVIAGMMAQEGYDGPDTIFEGQDGFLNAYSYQREYDANIITRNLGREWTFARSSIKVYPCCRYSGGHIDACLEIASKYRPKPEKIERIFVRSSKYTLILLTEPRDRKLNPKTVVDLQFSMPFQAAIALVRGKVDVEEFDMENARDPLVKRLMERAEWIEDAEFERRYPEHYSSAVTVTMDDGREYTAVVEDPKGDWRNPITQADLEKKFSALAKRVIADDKCVQEIVDFVGRLDAQKSIRDLLSLIGCPSVSGLPPTRAPRVTNPGRRGSV
jgi:2-methylcitrate dehydratase PrpD